MRSFNRIIFTGYNSIRLQSAKSAASFNFTPMPAVTRRRTSAAVGKSPNDKNNNNSGRKVEKRSQRTDVKTSEASDSANVSTADFAENSPDIEDLNVDWSPPSWRVQLDNIRSMRAGNDAPVDSMGCDTCCDTKAEPKERRFQLLLALMLSSQTKDQVPDPIRNALTSVRLTCALRSNWIWDQVTSAAMRRLIDTKQCNVAGVLQMSAQRMEEIIKPVGFYKKKVAYIKAAAAICQSQHGGDIPSTLDGLCALPGVGPKMAHLCMRSAWNQLTGIGVDTHVHRVANRLGWVRKPTKQPEATRKDLERFLPSNGCSLGRGDSSEEEDDDDDESVNPWEAFKQCLSTELGFDPKEEVTKCMEGKGFTKPEGEGRGGWKHGKGHKGGMGFMKPKMLERACADGDKDAAVQCITDATGVDVTTLDKQVIRDAMCAAQPQCEADNPVPEDCAEVMKQQKIARVTAKCECVQELGDAETLKAAYETCKPEGGKHRRPARSPGGRKGGRKGGRHGKKGFLNMLDKDCSEIAADWEDKPQRPEHDFCSEDAGKRGRKGGRGGRGGGRGN